MNIMDAAIAIFDPTLRSSLDEQVGKQTQKDIDKRRKMEEQSIGNKSKDKLENEAPIGSFMEMVESQIDHLWFKAVFVLSKEYLFHAMLVSTVFLSSRLNSTALSLGLFL